MLRVMWKVHALKLFKKPSLDESRPFQRHGKIPNEETPKSLGFLNRVVLTAHRRRRA